MRFTSLVRSAVIISFGFECFPFPSAALAPKPPSHLGITERQNNRISQAGFPEGYIIFALLKLEIKLEESRKQPERHKRSEEQRQKRKLISRPTKAKLSTVCQKHSNANTQRGCSNISAMTDTMGKKNASYTLFIGSLGLFDV